MSQGSEGSLSPGWATRQLSEFLTLVSSFDEESSATSRLVERAAEVMTAEVAAIIERNEVVLASGSAARALAALDLRALTSGRTATLELKAGTEAKALCVPVGEADRFLVIVREGAAFARAEVELAQGLGRAIALGSRTLSLVDQERGMRASSEMQVAENARLLEALRGRQAILERLATIQRAIVAQEPLHEIFDKVVAAACELSGDSAGMMRMRDMDGSDRSTVVSSIGLSAEFLAAGRRIHDPGLGARAMQEGRLVVVDKSSDPLTRQIPALWRREGLHAGMAAPVLQGATVIGSVGIGSSDPNRAYTARDQQSLLALAEHTSLALNHARALDDVAHEAFHDSLTGLPNRALFLDRLSFAVARASRSGKPVGVLFIDIDDFKTVNDSLGHRAGDELLRAVASRLKGCLRPSDTIARLGGDEFAVLVEEIDDAADAATAAGRMLDSLADPIAVEGREVYVGASVGIAAGPEDAETLLRDADLAMYRAKAEGKGRYRAYAPHMHADIVERLEMEVDLKRAIEASELELHYQPIFCLKTGAVAGLEALVRWNHPTQGLVSPDRFIPLAEASGRIHDLGRWVLASACHQTALWRARYPAATDGIKVGVNLSAAQLSDDGIVDQVADALRTTQLDPQGLTLEITETALMKDLDATTGRLSALKSLGVEIAVDDFGVGHSSLRYLKQLPLDNLKIAKPFVDEIGKPDSDPPILRAILDLAEVFDLQAVAEGIEEPEQAGRLVELGCALGQGHLLSRPLPAQEADDLILRTGLLGGATSALPTPSAPDEGAAPSRSGSQGGPAAAI
ncbi:MAG: EAL domain-containing protein [Actinomycetota bacterium]|nr:EAL domain-containing protein [Actinomycetota bacterium]